MTEPTGERRPTSPLGRANERLVARGQEYGARLYAPRVLGNDHPVEGEVRAPTVHPDDMDDPADSGRRGRLVAEEVAAWDRFWWRVRRGDHPTVDQWAPHPNGGTP